MIDYNLKQIGQIINPTSSINFALKTSLCSSKKLIAVVDSSVGSGVVYVYSFTDTSQTLLQTLTNPTSIPIISLNPLITPDGLKLFYISKDESLNYYIVMNDWNGSQFTYTQTIALGNIGFTTNIASNYDGSVFLYFTPNRNSSAGDVMVVKSFNWASPFSLYSLLPGGYTGFQFGYSIASDSTGKHIEVSNVSSPTGGNVVFFTENGSSYDVQIISSPYGFGGFGYSSSINNEGTICSFGNIVNYSPGDNSLCILKRTGNTWAIDTTILNPVVFTNFGQKGGINKAGDFLVTSASNYTYTGSSAKGLMYIYRLNNAVPTLIQTIENPYLDTSLLFGNNINIDSTDNNTYVISSVGTTYINIYKMFQTETIPIPSPISQLIFSLPTENLKGSPPKDLSLSHLKLTQKNANGLVPRDYSVQHFSLQNDMKKDGFFNHFSI